MSAEPAPKTCRRGHPLGPNQVLVGFAPCGCELVDGSGGHTTWRCRTCDDIRYGDGHVDDSRLVRPANPRLG